MTARILVVDDEPDLETLIFRHQIRDGTVSFLFAHDGVEALTVLEANPDVDLVVTDILCRGWTGFRCSRSYRRTRRRRPEKGREPAPGSQSLAGRLAMAWIDAGAECPQRYGHCHSVRVAG
jgi:CheY-like chemotaxis protein